MKKLLTLTTGIFLLLGITSNASAQTKDLAYYTAKAPFKMPTITVPIFPQKTFPITDFGAVADGKTLNTEAIAKAIKACSEAGGGTVFIPKGTWVTGPIELKSNIELRTEEGTLVQFTDDHSKYPIIKAGNKSTKEGPASPIYAYGAKNIAITGKGIFDGAGESWRPVKKSKVTASKWEELSTRSGGVLSEDKKVWWPDPAMMSNDVRPYMVFFSYCENILVEDVTFRNSPKLLFYPNNCTNILMNRAHIFNEWWAQNGDGIDISACKKVAIFNCTVNAGDDGICMKSSGTPNADDKANLSEVLIAGCVVYRAHGGFVIGSNTDGGMKNIYVTDCSFIGSDVGVRVKSGRGRGGWVRDIYVDNITMSNIPNEAILFETSYEDKAVGKSKNASTDANAEKIPFFTEFHISNVKCTGARTAIVVNGLPEQKTTKIYFENLDMKTDRGFICKDAENITLKNVKIDAQEPIYQTNGCKNINIIDK